MGLVARRVALLMGGVGLSAMAMQGAAAQSTNINTQHVTLLERLVIGAGTPKVAIDTPQAVTVVTAEDIDQLQPSTTGEIFENVPGVTVVGSDRQFGEAFNIRGIGRTESSSDASRIVVTVDGAPKFNEQYRMGSFFSEPELYKQVEVLRGPASSTLYGAGAIGGVINFTTKDASDFIREGHSGAVRVKEGFSSNGLETATSVILAQQINETFEVLAAGTWRRSEDIELARGGELDGSAFDTWSGLLKGTAHFGENDEQSVTLSYQRWFSDAKDQPYAQTGTQAMFGIVDRTVIDQTAVLRYENPASDNPWVDLNASLSFSDISNSQVNHRPFLGGPPSPQTGDGIFVDTEYGYRTWQFAADNTAEWIGEGYENYLTLGLQASTQDRLVTRPGTAAPLPAHPQGTENKLGIFAQNEFVWDERLTLIAGARGDFHWVDATTAGVPDRDGVAFSPKLAALYEFNENFSVFGSVAHTERLPTIDELYSVSGATPPSGRDPDGSSGKVASLDLRKESANTVEAGFALQGYDLIQGGDTASVKVTGFYSDITDLIDSNDQGAFGDVPPPYYGNIGEARIYGVEIEGAYDSEFVFASLAYGLTVGEDLVNDVPLDTVPQAKIVATLGGKAPEWDLQYGATLTLASEGEYIYPEGAFGGDGPAEAWGTVDLFASWTPQYGPLEGLEAQFRIENVFDADYRENLSTDRSKGRTFKLSLARQFDY